MNKPVLVIMAAGMGSRFGGCKQITPVDEHGHVIMDYSIFDALRAGFGRVVCVIKPEMEADFRAVIGDRIYTDVKSGLNAGVTGILVLSGESTLQTLEESPDKPHLVLDNAGQLIPFLQKL